MEHLIGLGLIVAHPVGDYIVQNDWMARCKIASHPGKPPTEKDCIRALMPDASLSLKTELWNQKLSEYHQAIAACTIHCLLYTIAVWGCSFWWMPWWGLAACFIVHWPIDRFRLAGRWMRNISGQAVFATGPLSPWSIIVVDNTIHLLTLFVIAVIHFSS